MSEQIHTTGPTDPAPSSTPDPKRRQIWQNAQRILGVVVVALLVLAVATLWGKSEHRSDRDDGPRRTQTFAVTDFQEVSLDGIGDVDIRVGEAYHVEVSASEETLNYMKITVEDSSLQIGFEVDDDGDIHINDERIHIRITAPSLREVRLEGLGDVKISGLVGESFAVTLAGVGNIRGSGKVDELTVELGGMGDVNFTNLEARNAEVELDGVGDVDVWATESIRARLDGMGDISYRGDPERVRRRINGIGDIHGD